MASPQHLTVKIPTGSLGVTISRDSNGNCRVKSKVNPASSSSPLEVGDVLQSLNGIKLSEVQGAPTAWAKLFQVFADGVRNVQVQRTACSHLEHARTAVGGVGGARCNLSGAGAHASVKVEEKSCHQKQNFPIVRAVKQEPQATVKQEQVAAPIKNEDQVQDRRGPVSKPSSKQNSKKQVTTKRKKEKAVDMSKAQPTDPNPGYLSSDQCYYITKNNDTFITVCAKIGLDDWKQLAEVPFNKIQYGNLSASRKFFPNYRIRIPTDLCSKWKMNQLMDDQQARLESKATCSKCLQQERPEDSDPMLMCDGCDLDVHLSCIGLNKVPKGDWLCGNCLEILEARRGFDEQSTVKDENGRRSLRAFLPPLPQLESDVVELAQKAQQRFKEHISVRKGVALKQLIDNQRVVVDELGARVEGLNNQTSELMKICNKSKMASYTDQRQIMERYGIMDWDVSFGRVRWIKYKHQDGTTRVYRHLETPDSEWAPIYRKIQSCFRELNQATEQLEENENQLTKLKSDTEQVKEESKNYPRMFEAEERQLLLHFATLLGEGQLGFETKKHYIARRQDEPLYLGVVQLQDPDVQVLNMLQEPTELVLAVPVQKPVMTMDMDVAPIQSGIQYYLFGTAELLCSKRNDVLPIDFSHTNSMRNAQRHLITMLLRDTRNQSMQVSKPGLPTSVKLREANQEHPDAISKCFDLSELVRDCNYPIQNQPSAPTPKRLADNGLVLRDYQQASLQWLIDKENNPTGLGSGGELWSRMRSLDVSGREFFYCELTGSIVKDIFDFHTDVEQKDAAKHCVNLPSGAILGEEMGLGKTVIALSLVVASPPPKQNQVLPREYIAKIDHPCYLPPPSVLGCTSSTVKRVFLSNATLVIAPMTLCSQWQAEIERFAPWMSTTTLHNSEDDTVEEIASKDIIVASTFLLSQSSKKGAKTPGKITLLNKLKKIHFHRIFLDESHYNNTGERIKLSLASLSASHRYCVTGTPIGHSLVDLYGQLRFLRVSQFCRPNFWKQNVDTPYSERNYDALNILRSLLSRVVIRHSKEQTLQNGNALLCLPPRTVETLLLPFGSEAEQQVYEYINARNTKRFMELRSESPKTVLGKFIELTGMLYAARQACAHSNLVNLDRMQNLNEKIERERNISLGYGHAEAKCRKKDCNTREGILDEAISKARVSAKGRMREAVLQFHEGEIELMECPICFEATGEKDIALTPCAHKFCAECILNVLQSASSSREAKGSCPKCRETIKRSEITFLGDAEEAGEKVTSQEEDQKPKAMEKCAEINGFQLLTKDVLSTTSGASDRRSLFQPLNASEKRSQKAFCHALSPEFLASWNISSTTIGTKVSRLLEEIKLMIQKDPTSKGVVFSQFLGTLDIAGQEMAQRGLHFVRVDGMMKQHQRADAILSFTSDPSTRILLLSMRAGAAGLNLMAADHCFLMDVAMNSAIEEQAIDRIHRIGQTRPVVVKRFIMKNSIEERILSNRRALAADCPGASTHLDGAGMMEEEEKLCNRPNKRARHEDEDEMESKTFQRLQKLEALFGCSASVRVAKT